MTDKQIRKLRIKIKDSILHYLADEWNNHKRGRAHKENDPVFNREEGFCCYCDPNLEMIMDKVVAGIWAVDFNEQGDKCEKTSIKDN